MTNLRRATDPTEKARVMRRLQLLWSENPELRLGQLIGNVIREGTLYNVEDLDLIDRLESVYHGKPERTHGKDQ